MFTFSVSFELDTILAWSVNHGCDFLLAKSMHFWEAKVPYGSRIRLITSCGVRNSFPICNRISKTTRAKRNCLAANTCTGFEINKVAGIVLNSGDNASEKPPSPTRRYSNWKRRYSNGKTNPCVLDTSGGIEDNSSHFGRTTLAVPR